MSNTSETEKHDAVLTRSVNKLTEHLQKKLRILGVSAKAEDSDMVKFMEKWILLILDMETKADQVKHTLSFKHGRSYC